MPNEPNHIEIQAVLGEAIRQARSATGLTQEAAAAAAGIDFKRWQRIEAGQVNATIKTLARVAEAVNVDFWDLFCKDHQRVGTSSPQGSANSAT